MMTESLANRIGIPARRPLPACPASGRVAVAALLFTLSAASIVPTIGRADEPIESIPEGVSVGALSVSPDSISLSTPFEYRQLLVTGDAGSGETVDLTRLAEVTIEPPIAQVDEHGKVTPLASGTAIATIRYGASEVTVPVEVSGIDQTYHPSFVRDVQPVLSRLGCNQGTCHGSKDGKGGFKLSLRGYDALFDFRSLTDEIGSRRFNRVAPDQSLMLLKASGSIPHVGGMLTKPGEPYYELLRSWIADGVPFDLASSPRVASIAIEPQLPVVPRAGMRVQMRVMATYTDGAVRDVTSEAFVESGGIEIVEAGRGGIVTTLRRGEAPILVRYEGAYAATTLTVMGDRSGFVWQPAPVFDPLDELVDAKLQRMRILPSELCDDAEFVRRIYLDLAGLPPTADQVRAFLADSRPSRTKRDELIDRLIGSPEFVEYWTNKWADLLQVNRKFLGEEGSVALRNWIRDSIAENKPYDRFAREVLTADGSNLSNPPAAYWKVLREPVDAMENTTHLFLAIRFNCNKCHDHPFERWTQDQYYELAAYFSQVGRKEDPEFVGQRIGGSAVEGAVPLVEVIYDTGSGEVRHDRTGQLTPPKFPFEHDGFVSTGVSRRVALADWLTSAENPYFARSYVNRMWGYLTGVGIIEPIDDIRAGNPPTNPELLDHLTERFIESGFDMQQLVRTICRSRTYQLSVRTNPWNEDDEVNYSHAIPRRLPAEVLFDSFHFASGAPFRIPGAAEGVRAAELPDSGVAVPFLDDFGRPVRESACECERSSGVALGPVMKLVNGSSLAQAIGDPDNELARLTARITDDKQLVEELFLRFLARFPTEHETELALETFRAAGADLEEHQARLQEYLAELGPRQAQWEAQQTAEVVWNRLEPESLASDVGAEFVTRDDGSLLVTGPTGHDTYRIVVPIPASGLTGLKLEVLADPSLAAGGPGRADNGNLVLNEWIVERFDPAHPETATRVALIEPTADFSQEGWPIAGAVDGNETTGWAVMPMFGQDHHAVVRFAEPVTADGAARLRISLVQKFPDGKHLIGRFRLSGTDSPGRLDRAGIDPALAAALRTAPDDRDAAQQELIRETMLRNDLTYRGLKLAVEQSRAERANPRLVGVQDLAWALVNSPAFLFNR